MVVSDQQSTHVGTPEELESMKRIHPALYSNLKRIVPNITPSELLALMKFSREYAARFFNSFVTGDDTCV